MACSAPSFKLLSKSHQPLVQPDLIPDHPWKKHFFPGFTNAAVFHKSIGHKEGLEIARQTATTIPIPSIYNGDLGLVFDGKFKNPVGEDKSTGKMCSWARLVLSARGEVVTLFPCAKLAVKQ